ncbi:MAG TPA: hypothetical protein GYA08_22945 [Chloroflexi bacterium]|nr:hypothetical protein [Chloroflexota bacterium]
MRLPNCEHAHIPQAKVVDYLLSSTHPEGQIKAKFFMAHGFTVANWQQFAAALVTHAQEHPVARVEKSLFGIRYIIEGILRTPDGRSPFVRVVWFIEEGETIPRLVTAYPRTQR